MTDDTRSAHGHSVQGLRDRLEGAGYICGEDVATAVHLARELGRPILVEGPPGVGKTELAKATARAFELPLIRLQCYEGLDESKALYEWKYAKQILFVQLLRDRLAAVIGDATGIDEMLDRLHSVGQGLFSEDFLEERPLLQALRRDDGAVLLIDEVDKADPEFEAFLLELLSDFQVTIPELGTIAATRRPVVFLTSNAFRDIGDALRRRCLYVYLSHPAPEVERRILKAHVPDIKDDLCAAIVAFIDSLRERDLLRPPALSESIDWARALVLMGAEDLGREAVERTLGFLLKTREDVETARGDLPELVRRAQSAA